MRIHGTVATFLLALALPAVAQQPPLIERELLFDDPEISGAQISPDGQYIAFMKPLNKTRNVWVKKTSEPFSAARPVTADTRRPIPGYFWSRDGKFILFVQDAAGDENYNVYAVNPADSPAAGSPAPPARNITDAKGARAEIVSLPRSMPGKIYVGLNDRDKAWHDLYEVTLSTGERKLLRKNTDRVVQWLFDNKDQLRLATRTLESGDTEILRVDPDGFKKIYSCNIFEACGLVRFDKENTRVYIETNHGSPDLLELALLDPQTGNTVKVESDPDKKVDLGNAIFSDRTDELIATAYIGDRERIYWRDKKWEADYQFIARKFPGRSIRIASSTADEKLHLVSVSGDTEPGETYLFDSATKKLTLQYRLYEKLNRAYLAEMKPVRYESSDGMEIPAYLTLPKGVPAKNLPVVIFPHGGPWGRDMWGYNRYAQFLANRGYAVLAPNFRASTGYGKKFLNAGNLQWGEKMQDDLTWGAKWLVQKGIADPKRVGIMGGSYGGYATLAGVAFTPDLYAAAVSIVGPSNLITPVSYTHLDVYKRQAQLQRQSPLNSASKIKTPLLVAQGANDPRVNKAESDQIVIALRDRKFPVEYLVAPDEGHGFARPVNNMAMLAAAEKFFAKYLGGRYEERMSPETAERLKEITVDPKNVTLAKKVDAAAVGVPKPVAAPAPGVFNYAAKIQMGTQSVNLKMSTEVKQTGNAWTITDTSSTPMGDAVDSVVLDGSALTLLKRNVKQGPMAIELETKGNQVTGTMKLPGKDQPVDIDAGGALFAEGAGAGNVIACLPLAEGYATSFRNLDLSKMKVRLLSLKVAGAESVTVPAGTFEAWRVELSSADGGQDKTTMWIARDSRKPVKLAATAASLGGATITAELQ